MTKIEQKTIGVFAGLSFASAIGAAALTLLSLRTALGLPYTFEFIYLAFFAIAHLGFIVAIFRALQLFFPVPVGAVPERLIWRAHLHQLFYLMYFNVILKGWFIPVPWMKVFYQLLGSQISDNSYSGGIIYDANFVSIGKNTILGEGSVLTAHQIESDRLGYYPIRIGDGVTVGAHAVILPGVTIEDGAIVASGAVVLKGTIIGRGEVWGGVPARRLMGPSHPSRQSHPNSPKAPGPEANR